ncbi:MAG TPA: CopG family antitoxin [Terriglobia bacterium]|nr:CopG family antitoxin [Terriglobia bacterium]
MGGNKSSISKARSYREIGEFWDTHDLTDYDDRIRPIDFEVDIQSEVTYYPLEVSLSTALRSMARRKGVSSTTLLNLWVQERVRESKTRKAS